MADYPLVEQKIRDQKPQVIYLSGKTCTGKTTLARYISENFNFAHIELDTVVKAIESNDVDEGQKFVEVYRHRNDMELIDKFVTESRQQIAAALAQHAAVVLEGALASNETLAEVTADYNFLFIYLLPVNLDIYASRIMDRFKRVTPNHNSGLPNAFWKHIDKASLDDFYETHEVSRDLEAAITAYAKESMAEGKNRLDMFSRQFEDILVVEI